MSKLTLVEKMIHAYTHGEEMPLKGHVKLILEDVRDGTQKIEEGDNIITNAVASILANNWGGLASVSSLLPLKSLYGGCLMFADEILDSADNYNPPSDLDNTFVAHAGSEAPAVGWTGNKRGSPIPNEFVETDTSLKQVWLWDNTQGNSPQISCVCLCPAVLGNMGLNPSEDTYSPMANFGVAHVEQGTGWDLNILKKRAYSISDDGKTSKAINIDGSTFTEYTMRHDYLAFGIMRSPTTWQDVANRSATIRTRTNATFTFEDDNYYYVCTATSATALRVDKVAKLDFEVTQADMTFTGTTLYTGNMANSGITSGNLKPFGFDGRYLYYPNNAKTHFYKIDMTNVDPIEELDGTINISVGSNITNAMEFREPMTISSGLILGSNYLINGSKVYPVKETNIGISEGGNANQVWLRRKGASVYGIGKQFWSSSSWSNQGNVLAQIFLSSIYNLQSVVHKDATKTMRLEYVISEITT